MLKKLKLYLPIMIMAVIAAVAVLTAVLMLLGVVGESVGASEV